jgi:inorganic triphosphatase YgiF
MSDEPTALHELEAKFETDAAGRATLLAATAFGMFQVAAVKQRQQDDIYFDTAERALRIAGATLRVRRLTDGALLTFKGARQAASAAHVASRLEDEQALPAEWAARVSTDAPLPSGLDASPLRRARELVGTAQLEPIARLQNERTTLALRADAQLLELALDHCVGTRLADERMVTFDEVELEVKQGGEAALLAAHDALTEAVSSLRPSHATKLERTLG